MPEKTKVAILGAGKMGETLIASLLETQVVEKENLIATAKHKERADDIANRFGIRAAADNKEAVDFADVLILCVKPQTVNSVLAEIGKAVTSEHLLISIAASVSTQYIESHVRKKAPVVRAMPNTPCLIKKGMTALSGGSHASREHVQQAADIFSALGRTLILDEKHLDAVTGLSASGPAFIYVVIEAMAEGGVKVGLPRNIATELAAQAVLGGASMVLETGEHPALLKDGVTTPAGCTIDGLMELEEGGLRVTLIKSVVKATERAAQLIQN